MYIPYTFITKYNLYQVSGFWGESPYFAYLLPDVPSPPSEDKIPRFLTNTPDLGTISLKMSSIADVQSRLICAYLVKKTTNTQYSHYRDSTLIFNINTVT